MDAERAGRGYVDHLTDADLGVLAVAVGLPERAYELRRRPADVPALLDRPEVFERIFGRSGREGSTAGEGARLLDVSPFLAFAVAVHRAAAELATISYIPERSGPRQQVPVFDVPQLADFLGEPMRRLFLAELLASFARVSSGRYWVKTAHGPRPRRYSELDPVRLAGLLEAVPEAERPGVYRRLGDVALFLTGVFPDYTHAYALGPFDAARLLRAVGAAREEQGQLAATPPIQLFEHLGQQWYRQACALVAVRSAQLAVVAEVAERFRQARRVLNHIADRYLFPAAGPWFSTPGT